MAELFASMGKGWTVTSAKTWKNACSGSRQTRGQGAYIRASRRLPCAQGRSLPLPLGWHGQRGSMPTKHNTNSATLVDA